MFSIGKQPYEEFNVSVDFKSWLGSANTVSTYTVKAYDDTGSDVSSSMIGTNSKSGTKVFALLKAGSSGETYNVEFRIVAVDGQKFEADIELTVDEQDYNDLATKV